VRFLAFAALSVLLMTLDHRFQYLKTVRSAVSVAVYPVQYLVNFPVSAGEWMDESFSSRETLLAELTNLKTRQLLYDVRLQKLAALESENRRLRQLLDSSSKVSERVLIAELLAVDMEPFSSQVVINKGSGDDIYPGQPVLDAHGIMGQITRVTPLTSTAMLITDPNHAIPVAVNRNGLRTIAIGTGKPDELDVPNFPTNADIKIGDLLVSSGLGGRFPQNYPVATITAINIDPGQPFARVTARPTAELQRSREVLLVWPNVPEKQSTGEAQ
jgi:rod shape-determining protein MreC